MGEGALGRASTRPLLRSALRSRWASLLMVALVAGLGFGAVLAAAAGARRTLSAPHRLYEERLMQDVALYGPPDIDRSLVDLLGSSPAVAGLGEVAVAPVRLQKGQGLKPEAVEADQASLWLWGPGVGTEIRVPTILEGRLPDPSAPGEAIVSQRYAEDLGVGVGSTFTPLATTRADIECIVAQTCDQDRPFTVPVPIEIVGIAQFPDDLDDDAFAEQLKIEVGPATLTAMADEIGVVARVLGVRFDDADPGAPALDGSSGERFSELLRFFQKAAGPDVLEQLSMYDTNPAQITSTDALRLQVTGLVLGGALLALVSFGAASVLFSRHLQPSAPDQPVLAALGLRRIERFAPLALEAAIGATVATAIAVGVAVALSPLLPFGVGRVAEPDPGLAVDSTALVLGGGLLALLLAVVLALVAYRSIVRRPAHGRSATTSVTLAGRLRLQPVPATGTRFALEGRSEGWRAPVILTVGAAAVATALVTMSLLLSSSIGHALTTPSAAGSPWDGFATNSGPPEQIDLAHARQLADDDRVTATARVGQGPLGLAMGTGGDTISAIGIEPVRGRIEPIVLSGKAPSGPDEALVGPAVQDTFHLDEGDQLVVTGPDGPRPLRVVGVGLLPIINEEANGWAVVLPLQTLVDLGGFEDFGQSESGVAYRVADRGDLAEVNRAAQALVGDGTIALTARIPGSVSSLREVAELPYILAGLIGALGVLTIGFGLLLTVRHRRHELGVLRALGFRPGDARRAVHWQGVLTAAAGLVVGVPLGVVLGRQLWGTIASSVGVAPVPRLSAGTLVVVAAVVLVLGLVLSLGPAWRAGRLHPARTLRTE